MSRNEYIGERENLKGKRKAILMEVKSHRDSLLSELSLVHGDAELHGEYIAVLGVKLNECLMELRGIDKQIAILTREIGD